MFFDARNETAKLNEFELIEPGTYVATITEIGLKDDQYGNEYVRVELTFDDTRRKFFDNVYFNHPEFANLATKGRARMKLYCELAGLEGLQGPNDLKRLIGAQYLIVMGAYTPKNGGERKNVINNILAVQGEAPVEHQEEDDVPVDQDIPAPTPVRAAAPVAKPLVRRPLATPIRR